MPSNTTNQTTEMLNFNKTTQKMLNRILVSSVADRFGIYSQISIYSRARLIRMAHARKNHANYPSM